MSRDVSCILCVCAFGVPESQSNAYAGDIYQVVRQIVRMLGSDCFTVIGGFRFEFRDLNRHRWQQTRSQIQNSTQACTSN